MASGGGESGEGDIGFQIAPKVDVVFVLLLFFMASAGSQVIQKELSINLPSQGDPTKRTDGPTPIVIDVHADGRIEMNNQFYDTPTNKDLPQLRAWLKETIERFGDENPVVVRPDPQALHERVMDVLNAAAASGIKNLTFS